MHPVCQPRSRQARGLARWVVHLAMLALLLKAAVPLLASAAARLQGVAVAQVCDVYGVALPAQGASAHAAHAGPAGHHHAHAGAAQMLALASQPGEPSHEPHHDAHHGEHCALGALGALAWSAFEAVAVPAAAPWRGAAVPLAVAVAPRDGSALWMSRLKHGPPRRA